MKVIYFKEFIGEAKAKIPAFITINGKKKPTKNSNGKYISDNIESIEKFWKWFGESKMVDDKNRPLVCYHITQHKYDTFRASPYGKMGGGIYFTSIFDDLKVHNKSGGSEIYSCYLKIEKLMELENPFSKRLTGDYDGIRAFGGKNGEEILVYKPNQIKSIDNKGNWSEDSGNIYEDLADKEIFRNFVVEKTTNIMKPYIFNLPTSSTKVDGFVMKGNEIQKIKHEDDVL